MRNQRCLQIVFAKSIFIITFLLSPALAWAYVGPGSGLSAIGALAAILGTIFFAIVGFVWYPIKRLIRFFQNRHKRSDESEAS